MPLNGYELLVFADSNFIQLSFYYFDMDNTAIRIKWIANTNEN